MHAAMAIGAAVLVVLALFLFRRRETGYDVDQFERARSLTSEWARRAGGPTPTESGAQEGSPVDAAAVKRDDPPAAT